ncbi:hypothetical protein D3C73_1514390 [compost metagenome]
MMKPSSILVLDEPTASMETVGEHDVYHIFTDKRQGKLCLTLGILFTEIIYFPYYNFGSFYSYTG